MLPFSVLIRGSGFFFFHHDEDGGWWFIRWPGPPLFSHSWVSVSFPFSFFFSVLDDDNDSWGGGRKSLAGKKRKRKKEEKMVSPFIRWLSSSYSHHSARNISKNYFYFFFRVRIKTLVWKFFFCARVWRVLSASAIRMQMRLCPNTSPDGFFCSFVLLSFFFNFFFNIGALLLFLFLFLLGPTAREKPVTPFVTFGCVYRVLPGF